MDRIRMVTVHQERAVVQVGEVFLKIDADARRQAREIDAMERAPVPTPAILWHRPPVLALTALEGRPLGALGVPDSSSAGGWAAAGAIARRLHAAPLPPAPGWRAAEFLAAADAATRWIIDHGITETSVVDAVRRRAEVAFRDVAPVFIHGDFQPAHVYLRDDEVTAVIDWGDSCQGDPHFDLAVLTVGHEERLEAVLDGYGLDVDLDAVRGWWAYRRLTAVPWMVEHGFDATGDLEALRRTARS